MEKTKVSVIMPVYNAAKFLDDSISTVISQTEKNIELLCVDDGSTDESANIIKKYMANDERIKYFRQENSGAGVARNTGMKLAQGEYLLFLDADDCFEKTLIEESFFRAKSLDADILVFGGDCFSYWDKALVKPASWLFLESELDHESIEKGYLCEADKKSKLFTFTTTTVWNKLFKKSFIEANNICFQKIYVVDSMYFVMLAMMLANRIAILNKLFVHYRCDNPDSQLSKSNKNFMGIFEALLSVREEMDKKKMSEIYFDVFRDFAEKNIISRLQLISYGLEKKILYDRLHQSGLKELGLTHETIKTHEIKNIYDMNYEDYIYMEINKWINTGLLPKKRYLMPILPIALPAKVAIYGAGIVGKSYFQQVLNRSDCSVVAWVDKRYELLGYPIEDPMVLKKKDFDLIVLAINDKSSAYAIKRYLEEMGIQSDKIFWDKSELI